MAGSRKAMQEAWLDDVDGLMIELEAMRTDLAYNAVKARLAARGKCDFTAILCYNDACAFGAMAALTEAGIERSRRRVRHRLRRHPDGRAELRFL